MTSIDTNDTQPSVAHGANGGTVRVWDVGVRVAHWVLAAAFAVAYFTEGEDDVLQIHVWAGYAALAIVLWRVLWGFVGPEHARFANFVRGPGAVFGYLAGLLRGASPRSLGHNPAGGAMVVMLLAALLGTTCTGLLLYAQEEGAGPLAGFVAGPAAEQPLPEGAPEAAAVPATGLPDGAVEARADADVRAAAGADADDARGAAGRRGGEHADEEGEEGEEGAGGEGDEWLEEVHEFLANFTLFLVLLHIAGVAASSFAHRENLPRAMVTGRKRV